jgi:hypothetical protein
VLITKKKLKKERLVLVSRKMTEFESFEEWLEERWMVPNPKLPTSVWIDEKETYESEKCVFEEDIELQKWADGGDAKLHAQVWVEHDTNLERLWAGLPPLHDHCVIAFSFKQ